MAQMVEGSLPQLPTDTRAEVLSVEWLFEPLWPGTRMLARVRDGRVDLADEDGRSVEAHGEMADCAEILGSAILSDDALVDGVWTAQPFVGTEARRAPTGRNARRGGLAEPAGSARDRAASRVRGGRLLIEVDGMELHDVPFRSGAGCSGR